MGGGVNHKKYDWRDIEDYIADPIEYRFVDEVAIDSGKEAWGKKLLSSQDWYFKMHFPSNPIFPATLLMESIMQTGVFIVTEMLDKGVRLMMFHVCKSFILYANMRPGGIINTHAKLRKYRNGIAEYSGWAYEEKRLVCEMDFILIVPDEIPKIK